MTTPTSGMPSQAEVNAVLREFGVDIPGPPPQLPPGVNADDIAVMAASAYLKKSERDGKPVTQVIATRGERLAQLFEEFDRLKDQADAIKTKLDDVKDAIKATLHSADPTAARVQLFCAGRADGLVLSEAPRTYVDGDKLKAEYPDAYAGCSYEKPQWELRRIGPKG